MRRYRTIALIACLCLAFSVLLIPFDRTANAQGTFHAEFDFTFNDGGWAASPGGRAIWVGGSGWRSNQTGGVGTYPGLIQIQSPPLASASITSVTLHLSSPMNGPNKVMQLRFPDVLGTDYSESMGTNLVKTITLPGAGVNNTNLWIGAWSDGGEASGESPVTYSGFITKIEIDGTGTNPFPTATPTATPTHTPTPTPVFPDVPTAPRCDLIRQDIATFENLFAWQILPESAGAGHPPGDIDSLTMPSGVTADLELNLDTAAQYVIRLEFHRTATSTGGVFEMQLGTEPAFKIDIDSAENGTQVFEVPAGNYTPNPGNYNMEGSALYKLVFTAPTWSPNPGLVLDFICISVNTEGGGPGSGGGTGDGGGGGLFGGGIQQTACEECSYNPVGDLFQDIPRLIEWLWCGLSQLFDCVLRNVLYGLWQTIVRIIQIIAFLRLWAGLIIERAIAWVLGNLGVLAAWIGGHIINLLTAIGTPILNFASGFINGVLSLLAGLWGFFQQVLVVLNAIATFLTSAVGLVGNGFQFVVSIVEQIWHFISQVFGIVPILIGSLIAGLNASAASIPSWAPACNNPSSLLYYPCLGMYVLDNTIFLGPVYYLVPIAIALVAWQVIGWAIKQFREALTAR
jgi:hypothetical protein